MMNTIQANAFVTLDYVLKDEDGELLDSSDAEDGEPIRYVHGYGMLVPGLEAALAGMNPGDTKDVVVSAEEGYGEYDDELILEIDRSEFPDPKKVCVGDEFIAQSSDGDEVVMEVTEVQDDVVIVDANHPLAGMALHYSVKIRSVREATEDEIAKAAEEFEKARCDVHGDDCDHDHGHDHQETLIELGTKGARNNKQLLN